jgi:hypothetical protein
MDAEHSKTRDWSVPPNGQGSRTSKGMVWGSWTKYTKSIANPAGTVSNPGPLESCTPAPTS